MATLPEELLQLICFQLQPTVTNFEQDRIERNTLRSMALVSKACYRIVRPVLYHALQVVNQDFTGLRLLVRALLTKPETCDLVKEVYISAWEPEFSSSLYGSDLAGRPREEELDISPALRGLGLPPHLEDELRSGARLSLDDALLALLLLMCHKLQKIHEGPS